MKKTSKETTMKALIEKILTKKPKTRDNDLKLIVEYCKAVGKSTDLKDWVNDKHNTLESIRRCRQLIQQHNPELGPSEEVKVLRAARRTYVRNEVLNG